MKLWDLRQRSIARHTFEGKAESVRDVQFSPTNQFEFAAAFENGNIQKWDIRNPIQHERKWSAHNGLALTVDWHADGRLVASGGRDRQIKIWDMKSDTRKPLYAIQTMAPVARVNWRPGYETQIASCSLSADFRIHTWDLSRPYIPYYSLEAHDGVATGFLWHNSDTIWSCSKDRSFASHDIRWSYRPLDLLTTTAHAWSVFGDLTFAIEARRQSPTVELGPSHIQTGNQGTGVSAGPAPESLGRDLMQRRAGRRSAAADHKVEERPVVKVQQYIPDQRTGTAETDTFDHEAFVVLAQVYSIDSDDVWSACEHNAQAATELELYRTAQTWKILQLLYGTETRPPLNLTAVFSREQKKIGAPKGTTTESNHTPPPDSRPETVLKDILTQSDDQWVRDYASGTDAVDPYTTTSSSDADIEDDFIIDHDAASNIASDDSSEDENILGGLKIGGAGRQALARFGGAEKILRPFYG
ncbi:WD repeat-containing protein 24, partial [Borealophlyctis nickersoniae]